MITLSTKASKPGLFCYLDHQNKALLSTHRVQWMKRWLPADVRQCLQPQSGHSPWLAPLSQALHKPRNVVTYVCVSTSCPSPGQRVTEKPSPSWISWQNNPHSTLYWISLLVWWYLTPPPLLIFASDQVILRARLK